MDSRATLKVLKRMLVLYSQGRKTRFNGNEEQGCGGAFTRRIPYLEGEVRQGGGIENDGYILHEKYEGMHLRSCVDSDNREWGSPGTFQIWKIARIVFRFSNF